MNRQELITLIGDVLTAIDNCLSRADFREDDPQWHQLYALRRSLDDSQRDLVRAQFRQDSAIYESITADLGNASDHLKSVISDIQKIGDTINTVTQIVGMVGQLLSMAAV